MEKFVTPEGKKQYMLQKDKYPPFHDLPHKYMIDDILIHKKTGIVCKVLMEWWLNTESNGLYDVAYAVCYEKDHSHMEIIPENELKLF